MCIENTHFLFHTLHKTVIQSKTGFGKIVGESFKPHKTETGNRTFTVQTVDHCHVGYLLDKYLGSTKVLFFKYLS